MVAGTGGRWGSSTRNTRLKTAAALYVPRFVSVIAFFQHFLAAIFPWKIVGHGLSKQASILQPFDVHALACIN